MLKLFSRNSFLSIEKWIEDAKNEAGPNVTFLLIGNKNDLETREVETDEGRGLATKYGIGFLETSAKCNVNVREAFSKMSVEIMEKVESKKIFVDDVVNYIFFNLKGTQGVKFSRGYQENDHEKNKEALRQLKTDFVNKSDCNTCCY